MSQENVTKIPEEVVEMLANFAIGELPTDDIVYLQAQAVLRVLNGTDAEYTEKEFTPEEYITLTDAELRAEKDELRKEIYRQMDSKWPTTLRATEVIPADKIEEDFLATLENLRNSLEQQNS